MSTIDEGLAKLSDSSVKLEGVVLDMNNVKQLGDSSTDFTIICNGESYNVHKSILSANSLYFKVLLEGTTYMKEAQASCVEFKEVDSAALDTALCYMYEGHADMGWHNIQSLLNVGSHLQMDDFMECCCNFLKREFLFHKFLDYLKITNLYSLYNVLQYIEEAISKRFTEFSSTPHFFDLDPETFARIVSLDTLNVSSERWLFTQIERWWRTVDVSVDEACDVMQHVRFSLMSSEELTALLTHSPPYPQQIVSLIKSAIKFHDDFAKRVPLAACKQNRIRTTSPSLLLVMEGGANNSDYELVACQSLSGTPGLYYSLHKDTAHHKTCGVVTIDNFLYIVSLQHYGGFDHDSHVMLSCFDPRHLRQNCLPSPQHQVVPSGIAAVGRRIYSCGGVSPSNTVFVSNCESFDVDSYKWQDEPDLPSPLNLFAVVGLKDSVYISGGQIQQPARVATNQLLKLTAGSKEWVSLSPMRLERRSHSMVSVDDNTLIVCGGLLDNRRRSMSNEIPLEKYDIRTDQWTEISRATTLPGTSLGHYLVLPDRPRVLFTLGHELYQAQENEIWMMDLDESKDAYTESQVYLKLPPKTILNFTFAAYLYLDYSNQRLQKLRKSASRH